MRRVRLACSSAGFARRIAAFSSAGRPARPVPSSFTTIESRWRSGSRRAVKTRSRSTGECVCVTGTVGAPPRPRPSGPREGSPGSHSTNFSPIRLAGLMLQSAFDRNGAKPGSIRICTRALRSGVSFTFSTCPTRAPAIFTSWPAIR